MCKFNKIMLINLSNHPSSKWSEEQTQMANESYGEIVDFPFPNVDPTGDETYIERLADECVAEIRSLSNQTENVTVHLMGEMTLSFAILKKISNLGIECVASTTERIVNEYEGGKKEVLFKFVRFRKYI